MKLTRTSFLFALILFSKAWATPSSVFWTNCTTEVTATGIGSIEVDNYFTLTNPNHSISSFPTDVGFTLGLFTWKNISAEAGIDYSAATEHPVFFNCKIGIEEDKLFRYSPSMSIGIADVGTTRHTNFNVITFVLGRPLPRPLLGQFFVGGFVGNRTMGPGNKSFMVATYLNFMSTRYCDGREYYKWILSADYATGKSHLGGGGVGIAYYFTPDIDLQMGTVFFNSAKILGSWKWAVQLTVNIPVFANYPPLQAPYERPDRT